MFSKVGEQFPEVKFSNSEPTAGMMMVVVLVMVAANDSMPLTLWQILFSAFSLRLHFQITMVTV